VSVGQCEKQEKIEELGEEKSKLKDKKEMKR
jgi:hypothetical protein